MTVELPVMARGLLIGLAIAAPVGPIGVLCIRRSLADGPTVGLATGLGAAAADAVYGAVAAFGLTAVSGFLVRQHGWIRAAGGLFLCYLGLRTGLARPGSPPADGRGAGLAGAFAATFGLTLTNPMTILSFVAVFAGLGVAVAGRTFGEAAQLVLGVFLGSALWWLLLSTGVGLLRARLPDGALLWVNRVSGLVIVAFGLAALTL